MKNKVGPAPYNFDRTFELQLVFYLCSGPKVYGMIGASLEPEAFSCEEAQLAIQAVKQIGKETGKGPASTTIVIQRLLRSVEEGKMTTTQVEAVKQYLYQGEDSNPPSKEDIVKEVTPVLKRRLSEKVTKDVVDTFMKKGDMSSCIPAIEKIESIGRNDTSIGTDADLSSLDLILAMQKMTRLPTGMLELDAEIDGGLGKGELGVFLGESGSGKSIALTHVLTNAAFHGKLCAYATLEMSEEHVHSRIFSHVTGIPIQDIQSGRKIDKLVSAMNYLKEKSYYCPAIVKYFSPGVTTVTDLFDWIELVEERRQRKLDLLVIDYADLMHDPKSKDNTYKAMGSIYSNIRDMSIKKDFYCWTASQSQRVNKDNKGSTKLNKNNVSDSLNKTRFADLLVALNIDEEKNVTFGIAKCRNGATGALIGPLSTKLACARMIAVNPYVPE